MPCSPAVRRSSGSAPDDAQSTSATALPACPSPIRRSDRARTRRAHGAAVIGEPGASNTSASTITEKSDEEVWLHQRAELVEQIRRGQEGVADQQRCPDPRIQACHSGRLPPGAAGSQRRRHGQGRELGDPGHDVHVVVHREAEMPFHAPAGGAQPLGTGIGVAATEGPRRPRTRPSTSTRDAPIRRPVDRGAPGRQPSGSRRGGRHGPCPRRRDDRSPPDPRRTR